MSLRSKTQKTKKFGTPTTPTTTTPKAPSPKAPQIVRTITPTVTTGAPQVKSTITRKVITPTAAGQAAQQTFKEQLQTITQIFNTPLSYFTNPSIQSLEKAAGDARREEAKQGFEDRANEERKQLQNIELNANVQQIIGAIQSGKVLAPEWFQNNIAWVQTGAITSKEFLNSYYHLSTQGIIHTKPSEEVIIEEEIIEEPIIEEPFIELPELLPEVSAEPDLTITDNMVTQQVINFNIVNGRAVGSIRFVATNNFNPYYYNKNIVNIIQIKDPNGANILTYVKENRLNFTETERDEVINYDEDVKQNTRATVESFVWSSATTPTPFSKKFMIDISEGDPPHPKTSGFMAMGAAGAIAGLVLLGFIVDSKVGK